MVAKKRRNKRGAPPDRVKVGTTDWEGAVGHAMRKKRPVSGWPKFKKSKQD